MNKLLTLAALLAATPATAQTTNNLPADGSVRQICRPQPQAEPFCESLPYRRAVSFTTVQLPTAVEKAYAEGYGRITRTLKTTGGANEVEDCGGFLADRERRLVITALHCMPSYEALLHSGDLRFRNVPSHYVGSIPELDLALLQIDRVPEGMRALPYTEAVVGEPIYARSVQTESLVSEGELKDLGVQTYFEGTISLVDTVASKGIVKVLRYTTGEEGKAPSLSFRNTGYQMLRLGGAGEPGFSGSPLYNDYGQVVGIMSRGVTGKVSYVPSAANFARLLGQYKK